MRMNKQQHQQLIELLKELHLPIGPSPQFWAIDNVRISL